MDDVRFEFEGDNCIRRTYDCVFNDTYRVREEVLITKDVFIECYNRWIACKENEK